MNLCLVSLARVRVYNGKKYIDPKNINAILRYEEYFDEIYVVARRNDEGNKVYKSVEFIEEEYPNIKIKLYDEYTGLKKIISLVGFIKVCIEQIKKSDVVLSWLELKSNLIRILTHFHKKKYVVFVGGCNEEIIKSFGGVKRNIIARIVYRSNRNAVKNADYVHYVTEHTLQKKYPTQGVSIGVSDVSVNMHKVNNLVQEREKKFFTEDDQCIIRVATIGYLNAVKGIDFILDLASTLPDKYHFYILGGGDQSMYLNISKEKGISHRIHFEGILPPGKQVIRWLKSMDLYLQPSRSEGLSRATIEAMSVGLPVITSNVMGFQEITHKEAMTEVGDIAHMERIIKRISTDRSFYYELVMHSQKVSEKYTNLEYKETIKNFYKKIAKEVMGIEG